MKEAQYNLGLYYKNGWGGMPQDMRQAAYWLKQAAAQGHRKAASTLRKMGN